MAARNPKFHGRVEGARDRCAVPGCCEPGEFKAPLEAANFDGPGSWRFLCLEHGLRGEEQVAADGRCTKECSSDEACGDGYRCVELGGPARDDLPPFGKPTRACMRVLE